MSLKNRIGPAPSTRAASTSSSGTVRKNWRNRKVAVAEAISGIVRPAKRVEHPEVGHHLVGGHDAHLHRQHQRDEDGPEEQVLQREAEVDDGEGRQQRDGDLAEGDDERRHQAHPHHAGRRGGGARPRRRRRTAPSCRSPPDCRRAAAASAPARCPAAVCVDATKARYSGKATINTPSTITRWLRTTRVRLRSTMMAEPSSVLHFLFDVAELDDGQCDDDHHQHHRLRGRAAQVPS